MSRLPADACDPLLERDVEQRALVDVLERARDGIGGFLVVEGPAGIGKTQLIDTAKQIALDRRLVMARARGGSLEQDVSFGVVRQLFEPLIAASGDVDALFAGGATGAAPVFGRPATGVGDDDNGPGTVLHGLYWLTVAPGRTSRAIGAAARRRSLV